MIANPGYFYLPGFVPVRDLSVFYSFSSHKYRGKSLYLLIFYRTVLEQISVKSYYFIDQSFFLLKRREFKIVKIIMPLFRLKNLFL